MAFYKFLDATGAWSDPIKTSNKYLRADGTWVKANNSEKFLRADGTWNGMVIGQEINKLSVGTKVKFLKMWGEPIQWRIIGKSLTGMPSNSVTLLSDKIIAIVPFDAAEPNNPRSGRAQWGNNDYTVSNIRQWLNSTASAGRWYSAQHAYDQAPDKDHVTTGYNAYDTWAGFLNGSTTYDRNALLNTTRNIGVYPGNGTSCTDKIFLLTRTELGNNGTNDGTRIPYFSADHSLCIAQLTEQCIAHSNYPSTPSSASSNWYYWTATSSESSDSLVGIVGTNGYLESSTAFSGYYGVRPACNISNTSIVSFDRDSDNCYQILT